MPCRSFLFPRRKFAAHYIIQLHSGGFIVPGLVFSLAAKARRLFSALNHHNAILPATPKSSVALAMPNAWNTRLITGMVILLFPLSKRHICDLCTPMRLPSSSWVRFWDKRTLRIASPKQYEFTSSFNCFSIASRFGVPFFPQTSSTTADNGVKFICAIPHLCFCSKYCLLISSAFATSFAGVFCVFLTMP